MKIIQKTFYVTDDGKEFTDEKSAQEYVELKGTLEAILAPLGKIPNLSSEEYHQHSLSEVNGVYIDLLNFCKKRKPTEAVYTQVNPYCFDNTYATNLVYALDRFGIESRLIINAWARLACIDSLAREFNQPYFASTKDPFDAKRKGIPERKDTFL